MVTEKEAFAVVFGVRHFHVYLLGRKFELITNHSALRWLHTMEPTGRLARWIMDLQEVQIEIKHKNGTLHSNEDALSWLRSTKRPHCAHPEPVSVEDKDADKLAVDS